MCEAGVPATANITDFTVFVDRREIGETGLALVNPTHLALDPQLRLYDTSFNPIAARSISEYTGSTLSGGGHLARFAVELFPELRQFGMIQGIITIESSSGLAAITLRQDHDPRSSFPDYVPTLTTYPIMAGRADSEPVAPLHKNLYFPQIAQGLNTPFNFETSLFLVATNSESTVQIEFFGSDGAPLEIPFEGRGSVSRINWSLTAGQAVSELTESIGPLVTGSAVISADNQVEGSAVFSAREGGIKLFEGGVPAAQPMTDFSLIVNQRDKRETGFALVNTGTEGAQITFRLYDSTFNLLETATLEESFGSPLLPGGHLARFLFELFSAGSIESIENGLLTVDSTQPLAAITLIQTNQIGVDYPEDIYRITIYPVIEGRPD
jgi:hypothetical protein